MSRACLVVLVVAACSSPAKPRHGDAKRVVDACLALTGKTVPVEQARAHLDQVTDTCANVYVEAKCRDAYKAVVGATDRVAALASAMTSCRDVYCPLLPGTKPKACTPGDPAQPPQPGDTTWRDLEAAIYRFDLGPTEGARLAASHKL